MPFSSLPDGHVLQGSTSPGEPLIKFLLLQIEEGSSPLWGPASREKLPSDASQTCFSINRMITKTQHIPNEGNLFHYFFESSAAYGFKSLPSRENFAFTFAISGFVTLKSTFLWDFTVLLNFHKKPVDVIKIPILRMKKPYCFTYDLPTLYARQTPSLTQDLMLMAGVPPCLNLCILHLTSVSMERSSMGGKHAGGEVSFLQALLPRSEQLVTFVPSGAQGGPAVSLSLGRAVLSEPRKGDESTSPFCASAGVFP